MPNPRAQRPLSLQAVTEDIRSLAQPAEALLDMLAGAAKGSVSATAGVGGDLESLARGLTAAYRAPSGQRMEAFAGGMEQPTVLPTTRDISAKLPAVVPTTAPLSRQHTAEYGQGMGEFIPTPGSARVAQGALNAVKSIPAAIQHGAQEFAVAAGQAGPRIFIGPKAKTFNQIKLEKAQALEKQGVDPVDIWRQTGTFKGADGIWRQEISDQAAKFLGPDERKQRIEDINAKIAELKGQIAPTPQKDLFPKALTEAKKDVREDISILRGDVKERSKNPRTQGLQAQFIFEHPELYAAYPELRNLKVNTEGGVGSTRGALSIIPSEGLKPGVMEMDIYDRGLVNNPTSTALHEMQHAVQTLEGMGPGGSPTVAFQDPLAHDIYKRRIDAIRSPGTFEEFQRANRFPEDKAQQAYQEYLKTYKPFINPKIEREVQQEAAMEYYKRLAGEAEARAAQERQMMSPHQRTMNYPYSSYDVPEEDLIVKPPREFGDGGSVHISDNTDTMMMELAGGGEVKMDKGGDPKKAEQDLWAELRASIPKDSGLGPIENLKQNLSAVYEGAKKVPSNLYNLATNPVEYIKNLPAPTGEQIINAFSPADMGFVGSYKPHTPLKPDPDVGTRYKVTDTGGLAPRKDLNIEDLQGSQVKVFPWDATSRNKLVTEVSDVKLQKPVLTEGGDDYMRDLQHIKQRIAGASNEGIAKRIMDRINEASVENQMLGDGTGRVFGFPIRMGAKAEYASTFPTDIMKDIMEQASLKKAEKKALDESMRNMVFEGKKGVFKDMAPFGSPEFFSQLENGLKSNKEKDIKGFTDMNMRKAFMDRMALVEQQKRLGYNIQDLTGSVLAEELKGVPKGYVGNVAAELDVFGKLRPSQSSTYSHDFPGAYAGSMPNMPVEILMPKTFENIYKEMKIEYPNASKEALRNMTIGAMEKRKNQISEKITQRNIDAVKTYQEGLMKGEFDPNDIKQVYDYMLRKKLQLKMAQGGQVHKAAGGEITADDLTIEERPL